MLFRDLTRRRNGIFSDSRIALGFEDRYDDDALANVERRTIHHACCFWSSRRALACRIVTK